ncbi:MAG: hypothetical protein ACRD0P_23230 [Stackebrandtia sp.]
MNPRYLTTPAPTLGWADIRHGLAAVLETAAANAFGNVDERSRS